ncbi:MAG: ABC transporter ATP-binding protein [Thermus sp.]|uniref:ABC transporter ATP-binding protein n=1 Tax=Thermus sp. TaxID=275 RepID=UPI0033276F23
MLLRAEGLSYRYETPLFQRISLVLAPGEVLAVLGPSGSGKTTLLHLLAGLLPLQEGEVYWEGLPIRGLSQAALARRRLGFLGLVLQHHFLMPELTALENVLLPGYLAGRVDRVRGQALLERVGLAHRMNALPLSLSGGERQRLAVARALYLRPRLVLADEPTASLDRVLAREVFGLLLWLCREEGVALLVATHDEGLVQGLPRLAL